MEKKALWLGFESKNPKIAKWVREGGLFLNGTVSMVIFFIVIVNKIIFPRARRQSAPLPTQNKTKSRAIRRCTAFPMDKLLLFYCH